MLEYWVENRGEKLIRRKTKGDLLMFISRYRLKEIMEEEIKMLELEHQSDVDRISRLEKEVSQLKQKLQMGYSNVRGEYFEIKEVLLNLIKESGYEIEKNPNYLSKRKVKL